MPTCAGSSRTSAWFWVCMRSWRPDLIRESLSEIRRGHEILSGGSRLSRCHRVSLMMLSSCSKSRVKPLWNWHLSRYLKKQFTHKPSSGRPRCSLCLHQVWRNVSLHQCLSNGSEWVPSEWESDKNITPHQLTSGEDKRWNKSSIKMLLTSNRFFWL